MSAIPLDVMLNFAKQGGFGLAGGASQMQLQTIMPAARQKAALLVTAKLQPLRSANLSGRSRCP